MRSIAAAAVLTAIGLVVAAPASAQEETTWIEGHVFNKWTGVPLQNVAIFRGQFPPPEERSAAITRPPVPRAYTDASGFFSFALRPLAPGASEINLTAVCFDTPKKGTVRRYQVEGTVRGRPGTVRRDFYVPGRRQHNFDYCQLVLFPQ